MTLHFRMKNFCFLTIFNLYFCMHVQSTSEVRRKLGFHPSIINKNLRKYIIHSTLKDHILIFSEAMTGAASVFSKVRCRIPLQGKSPHAQGLEEVDHTAPSRSSEDVFMRVAKVKKDRLLKSLLVYNWICMFDHYVELQVLSLQVLYLLKKVAVTDKPGFDLIF